MLTLVEDHPADPRFEGRYLHVFPGMCSIGPDDSCEATFLVNHIAMVEERVTGSELHIYNGTVTLTAFQSGTFSRYDWDFLQFQGKVEALGEARGTLTAIHGEVEDQVCVDTATLNLIAGEPDELRLSCPGFDYSAERQAP